MKKYILTTFLFLAVAIATPAFASEQTGTISTGVETGINGMVVVKPTANPVAGSYTSAQSITLTGGAGTQEIRYIIDGSAPTCSTGTVYSSPISISSSAVISAISCYAQGAYSPVVNFAYVISSSPPSGPSGGGGGGGGGAPPPSDDADFNNDGKVDILDLNILTVNWGSNVASNTTGDANNDSKVDLFDLNILSVQWTG